MSRNLIRLIILLSAALLAAGSCLADLPGGIVSRDSLGIKKDVTYNFNIAPEADPGFVLVAFEGSRMDPRKKGGGVIWTEGLDRFNVVDFSIADELCAWQVKMWETVSDLYSAAVEEVLREKFGGVKTVGVYSFSKGASAVDSVCRRLRESGIRVAFVWLNDAFTTHGLPFVTELTESNEVFLYNRYSRDERVNQLSKKLHQACSELPNVDSRHISTYHGGLMKYVTFPDELADAVRKATFVR